MKTRVLVAGIGNIFFRDDGFGPAVTAAMLSSDAASTGVGGALPEGVRVVDYGIRGMHLTYDLLAGVEALVLVDAVPGGAGNTADRAPGSLTVLEVGPEDLGEGEFDAHGMQPVSVLASLGTMGGELPPTFVVGCVPADVSEGIGLSAPVAAAVDQAMGVVTDLIRRLVAGPVAAMPAGERGGGD
ncbi:MAG: hydrogenase maturation protease [Actinomycetota bacterium]|nr:hydrogenase maturation protease [Actinomycetota bacterium]